LSHFEKPYWATPVWYSTEYPYHPDNHDPSKCWNSCSPTEQTHRHAAQSEQPKRGFMSPNSFKLPFILDLGLFWALLRSFLAIDQPSYHSGISPKTLAHLLIGQITLCSSTAHSEPTRYQYPISRREYALTRLDVMLGLSSSSGQTKFLFPE
jgi:hypothetical protein